MIEVGISSFHLQLLPFQNLDSHQKISFLNIYRQSGRMNKRSLNGFETLEKNKLLNPWKSSQIHIFEPLLLEFVKLEGLLFSDNVCKTKLLIQFKEYRKNCIFHPRTQACTLLYVKKEDSGRIY